MQSYNKLKSNLWNLARLINYSWAQKKHKKGTFLQIPMSNDRPHDRCLDMRRAALPHLYFSSYRVTKTAGWLFEKKAFKKMYTDFWERTPDFSRNTGFKMVKMVQKLSPTYRDFPTHLSSVGDTGGARPPFVGQHLFFIF